MRLLAAVLVPAVLFGPLVLLAAAVLVRDLWRRWRGA
jgi:hypothetical protein